MKKYRLKIAALILTILTLTLILTSCGGKTSAKAPTDNKIKPVRAVNKAGVNSTNNQTEQQQFTSELSVANTEMDDIVNEIDAALKGIDQIDGGQDNVPNL